MKNKFLITCLLLLSFASVNAQQPQFNTTQYRGAFAKEKLTVNGSTALTAATYAPSVGATCGPTSTQCQADYAYITVETDCLRYWPTGDAPTSTDGHKVCDGGSFTVSGFHNIANLHMIKVTNNVTVQVSYYRFFTNSQ